MYEGISIIKIANGVIVHIPISHAPYTEESVSKKYRELAKILHPDKGGDKAEFQLLTREHELVKKIIGVVGSTRPGQTPTGARRARTAPPRDRQQPLTLEGIE